MSWTKHNIITVTSFVKADIVLALAQAINLFGFNNVSAMLTSPTNGFYTFMIGPDGSKEGWPESLAGEENRKLFLDWLDDENLVLWAVHTSFNDMTGSQAAIEQYVRHVDKS